MNTNLMEMKSFPGTPKEYANAIRVCIECGYCTLEHANTANHFALERKLITFDQFKAAANVLAGYILRR